MSKPIILLFVLLVIGTCFHDRLYLKYGRTKANLYRTYGKVHIDCNGVVGVPTYHYENLPKNWYQSVLRTSYIIRLKVVDQAKNHLQVSLKLAVNGLDIEVEEADKHPSEQQESADEKKSHHEVQEQSQKLDLHELEALKHQALQRQRQAQHAVTSLQTQIYKVKDQIKKGQGFLETFKHDRDRVAKLFDQCNAELKALNDKLAGLQADLQRCLKDLQAARKRSQQLSKQNQLLKSKRDDLVAQNEAFQKLRPILQKQIAAKELALAECLKKLKALNDQRDELNAEVPVVQHDIKRQNQNIDKSQATIKNLQGLISDQQALIEQLKKKLAQAQARKENYQSQKAAQEKILAQSKAKLQKLQNRLAQLNNRLQELAKEISSQEAECKKLEEELNAAKQKLKEEEQAYAARTKQIHQLNALIEKNDAQLQKLRHKIIKLQKQVDELKHHIAQLKKHIAKKQEQCDKIGKELEQAQEQVRGIQARLKELQAKLDQLNAKLEKAQAQLHAANRQVDEICAKIDELEKHIPKYIHIPAKHDLDHPKTLLEDLASKHSYPLSPLSNKLLNRHTSFRKYPRFDCDVSGEIVKGSGVVSSINPGVITVRNEFGERIDLDVAPCSTLKSTKENHVLDANDIVEYHINKHNGANELQLLICYG